jgi:type II secretory pathway pseudopilin PulG
MPRAFARSMAFSLVEMATVVAVLMLLAAIAIPQLRTASLKAKRAEVPLNVDGIVVAERAYLGSHDAYVNTYPTFYPTSFPGKTARAWPTNTPFAALGWSPDGLVYGNYGVFRGGDMAGCIGGIWYTCPGTSTDACAIGGVDLDADSQGACWYQGLTQTASEPLIATSPTDWY